MVSVNLCLVTCAQNGAVTCDIKSCSPNQRPKLYVNCLLVLVSDCLAPKHAETLRNSVDSSEQHLDSSFTPQMKDALPSGKSFRTSYLKDTSCTKPLRSKKHEQTWTNNIWASCCCAYARVGGNEARVTYTDWVELRKDRKTRSSPSSGALQSVVSANLAAEETGCSGAAKVHLCDLSYVSQNACSILTSEYWCFALQNSMMLQESAPKTGFLLESTARETRSNIAAIYFFMFKSCFVQSVATATKFGVHHWARNSYRKQKERRAQSLSC